MLLSAEPTRALNQMPFQRTNLKLVEFEFVGLAYIPLLVNVLGCYCINNLGGIGGSL